MLCNATWRFKNFNIDNPEHESCRNAHRELQERIEALEDGVLQGLVEGILADTARPTPPVLHAHALTSVVSRLPWPPTQCDNDGRHRLRSSALLGALVAVVVPAAIWWIQRRRGHAAR